MIRKSDISLRIGMIMMFLCATLVLTALPAAANYTGDHNLTEKYSKGTVTGGMSYTIGNSTYSPKLWSYNTTGPTNDSYFVGLTPDFSGAISPTTSKARLYVCFTYSFNNTSETGYDIGVEPNMTVTFDGVVLNTTKPADSYTDWKDESNKGTTTPSYNFPSGVYAYDVTNYVNASRGGPYVVNVTNSKPYNSDDTTSGNDSESFNVQAVGLLTLYNDSGNNNVYDYWVDEGCDLTYLKCTLNPLAWQDNRMPTDTKCWAKFSNVDTSGVSSATLITTAPSAGTPYNTLFLNNGTFDTGVWDGSPAYVDFSYNTTTIDPMCLVPGENSITFMNGLDNNTPLHDTQMQAANAFLLLNKTA